MVGTWGRRAAINGNGSVSGRRTEGVWRPVNVKCDNLSDHVHQCVCMCGGCRWQLYEVGSCLNNATSILPRSHGGYSGKV